MTIERAVDSILNQSYQNFEMIIVDDGSSDSSLEVLKKYSHDERIKILKLSNNSGVNIARNTGLKNVSEDSEWITFLDSDDEFTSDALSNMKFTISSNPAINYFRFPVKYLDGKSVSNISLFNTVADYEKYISHMDKCGEWVVTFHKKVLKDGFLYDERVKAFESLSWLALSKNERIFYGDFFVRLYYLDVEGITRPTKKTIEFYRNLANGLSLILEDHGEAILKYNRNFYATYLYELANLDAILGNKKEGVKKLLKAMRLSFFNIGVLRFFKNSISKRF